LSQMRSESSRHRLIMAYVVVESLGNQNFYSVRDTLISQGKKFDEKSLALVNYSQLTNCALGIAEGTTCSLQKVREEKQRRRARFLSLDAKSLDDCKGFLQIHKMWDDINQIIKMKNAPAWDELPNRVKAWAKLICLTNHLDFPARRFEEVKEYLRKSTIEELECHPLPEAVATNYIQRVHILTTTLEDQLELRDNLAKLAEDLTVSFSEFDHKTLEEHLILDYSCTSDCFRVVSGNN
jgi:hypothetical protein